MEKENFIFNYNSQFTKLKKLNPNLRTYDRKLSLMSPNISLTKTIKLFGSKRILIILTIGWSILLILHYLPNSSHPISLEDHKVNGFLPQNQLEDFDLMNYQTDLKLIKEIQWKWLEPPSAQPYGFTLEPNDWTTIKEMHQTVLKLLNHKRNGFYVEAGALDGVYLSNTLHLEMDYNWSGLLVESDPQNYKNLKSHHRKAWTINACLALRPQPEKVQMTRIKTMEALSGIAKLRSLAFNEDPKAEQFESQCFPLVSILGSIPMQKEQLVIDYFSLDIEGAEMQVLKTIPWNFVYIKVMSIEVNKLNEENLTLYMDSHGFSVVGQFSGKYIEDFLFVNRRHLREHENNPEFEIFIKNNYQIK